MPLYLVNRELLTSYPGLHVDEKLRICQDQSIVELCRYPFAYGTMAMYHLQSETWDDHHLAHVQSSPRKEMLNCRSE